MHSPVRGGSEYKRHTSKTDVSPFQSPSQGFAGSVQANQQQLILGPAVQHQSNLMQSPAAEKPEHAIHTPTNTVSTHKLPSQGSVSLSAKQQQLFHDSAVQPQRNLIHSLGREESEYGVHTPERAVSPIQSSLQGSVSSLRAKRQQCVAEENVQSSKQKMNNDNNMLHSFNQVDVMSPISIQDPMRHDHDVNCQNLQSEQDSVNIQNYRIGRKRGIRQVLHEEKDAVSGISRTLKTQKLSPEVVGVNSAKEHHMECNNEVHVGGQAEQKHWTEILSKVCEGTKQLDSPSVYGLRELDIMEGILAELQTSRKYERLSSSLGNLGDPRQKRVTEARALLDKLVFEKAKLQLKHMKLDILSNKAELCQSRLQECEKLKSAYAQFISARAVDTLDRLPAISINSNSGNQESLFGTSSLKNLRETSLLKSSTLEASPHSSTSEAPLDSIHLTKYHYVYLLSVR